MLRYSTMTTASIVFPSPTAGRSPTPRRLREYREPESIEYQFWVRSPLLKRQFIVWRDMIEFSKYNLTTRPHTGTAKFVRDDDHQYNYTILFLGEDG